MLKFLPKPVWIVGAARTPVGSFLGSLATKPAFELGAISISNAIRRALLDPDEIQGAVVGQALLAGCGQASARQATLAANLPYSVDVFNVNKVCASGMKSITAAAQSIALGQMDVMVAAGMESMSNVPFYIRKARDGGYRYGHGELTDGLLFDGLWDPYNDLHMGQCTEHLAKEMGISREEQDAYAIQSYTRAAAAWSEGIFNDDVIPIEITVKKKVTELHQQSQNVGKEEEIERLDLSKVPNMKPAFAKSGTLTAANSSSLNDGGAAVVLMSEAEAKKRNVKGLARILAFADAAVAPIQFGIAPSLAVKKALSLSGNPQVDIHECNEAFSAVVLANMRLLNLDHSNVNILGGAVSIGHPIGMSGCRIVMSLINALNHRDSTIGCASICNGGGGATALILERI
uniref:Acetyl-CoA acyltransferase 1 n=1 Tax=Nephromyces sp. MMRI TaxID=2496275 RepID=A0A3S8V316_9APIC|nr:acetyl-CoA acyltransferase 1 [Nephromyces sp. MMRI]